MFHVLPVRPQRPEDGLADFRGGVTGTAGCPAGSAGGQAETAVGFPGQWGVQGGAWWGEAGRLWRLEIGASWGLLRSRVTPPRSEQVVAVSGVTPQSPHMHVASALGGRPSLGTGKGVGGGVVPDTPFPLWTPGTSSRATWC